MGTIFRTATKQAILDLISDHGTRSRFGQLLSDDDADALALRVVDLFEMTLELRARTGVLGLGGASGAGASTNSESHNTSRVGAVPKSWSEQPPSSNFPTTVHASEFIDHREPKGIRPEPPAGSEDLSFASLKLPRTRKPLSDSERQNFLKRR
jgi:hypothetical protein